MLLNMGVRNSSHECKGFLYWRVDFESPLITPVCGDPQS